jgi:hypothetical protein
MNAYYFFFKKRDYYLVLLSGRESGKVDIFCGYMLILEYRKHTEVKVQRLTTTFFLLFFIVYSRGENSQK